MKEKQYKGKAIYSPSGRAGEYSYWACNFYKGCSGGCTYCYLKKGILKKAMGMDVPLLKECFKNEQDAINMFERELIKNEKPLREHGLFFTFSSDPFLPETIDLTYRAINMCRQRVIPVKLLTKQARAIELMDNPYLQNTCERMNIAVGFTLTGMDELEPGCSPNMERVRALRELSRKGFVTWASLEPVIDMDKTLKMLSAICHSINHIKVGMLTGAKVDDPFDKRCLEMGAFMNEIIQICTKTRTRVYFKDSMFIHPELREMVANDQKSLPFYQRYVVSRNFNIFTNKDI